MCFRGIFDVVALYEKASWDTFEEVCARAGIAADTVSDPYVQTLEWAAAVLSGQEVAETNAP
jgi:hypothetical protein